MLDLANGTMYDGDVKVFTTSNRGMTPEEIAMAHMKWEKISGRNDLATLPISECLAAIKKLLI